MGFNLDHDSDRQYGGVTLHKTIHIYFLEHTHGNDIVQRVIGNFTPVGGRK